jgi:hypothetical protein
METGVAKPRSLRGLGILAILGHVLAFVLYVVLPGLEVPYPELYGFQAAWLVVLALGLYWLRAHPGRTVVLVVLGAAAVTIVRILGEQYLGWRG